MSSQMPQQRPEELGHVHGLEVVRLPAEIHPHVLTFRGYREGSQGRDAVMLVVVAYDRRLSLRCPSAPTRGDEEKAALIHEGEMGPKSLGFFLSPATGTAAHGPWRGRRVGRAAAPAPDSSSSDGVRSSRHGQGDSGCQTRPESPPRCASRSIARWESHWPLPLVATAAVCAPTAGRSIFAAPQASAWLPKRPCPQWPRLAASGRPSRWRPVNNVPPRVSLCPGPAA